MICLRCECSTCLCRMHMHVSPPPAPSQMLCPAARGGRAAGAIGPPWGGRRWLLHLQGVVGAWVQLPCVVQPDLGCHGGGGCGNDDLSGGAEQRRRGGVEK